MLQEESLRCHTQASDSKGERGMPIARFTHHLPRFRINGINSLGPLWMIGLCLCSLNHVRNDTKLVKSANHLSYWMQQHDQGFCEGNLQIWPVSVHITFRQGFHKFSPFFKCFRRPHLTQVFMSHSQITSNALP